jgi:hypothetical protein
MSAGMQTRLKRRVIVVGGAIAGLFEAAFSVPGRLGGRYL